MHLLSSYPGSHDYFRRCPEKKNIQEVLRIPACERWVLQVDSYKISQLPRRDYTCLYSQRFSTILCAIGEQQWARRGHWVGDQYAAALIAHASGVFGPAQFFDGIEAGIAIGADGERDVGGKEFGVGRDAITEVAFGGGTDADGAAMTGE